MHISKEYISRIMNHVDRYGECKADHNDDEANKYRAGIEEAITKTVRLVNSVSSSEPEDDTGSSYGCI